MSEKLFGAAKQIVKGAILSLVLTLMFVLVFACIMKAAILPTEIISSVNAVIRIAAIFLGCQLSLRAERGAIKGVLLGAAYTMLSTLVFGIMAKILPTVSAFALHFLISCVVGAISGIIAVNFFGKE